MAVWLTQVALLGLYRLARAGPGRSVLDRSGVPLTPCAPPARLVRHCERP